MQVIVRAAEQGTEPQDAQEHQARAEAEIARLQTLLKGQQEAVDQAGNRLAEAIAEHQHEWVEELAEAEAAAAFAYDAGIAEARTALAQLIPAHAGTNRVRNFDANDAKTGRYTEFSGGRVRVSGHGRGIPELRRDHDPRSLLALAATVTASSQ